MESKSLETVQMSIYKNFKWYETNFWYWTTHSENVMCSTHLGTIRYPPSTLLPSSCIIVEIAVVSSMSLSFSGNHQRNTFVKWFYKYCAYGMRSVVFFWKQNYYYYVIQSAPWARSTNPLQHRIFEVVVPVLRIPLSFGLRISSTAVEEPVRFPINAIIWSNNPSASKLFRLSKRDIERLLFGRYGSESLLGQNEADTSGYFIDIARGQVSV